MMKNRLSIRLNSAARCMAAGLTCLMMSSAQASEPRVLAAGSLRLAVTELIETYGSDQGVAFDTLFGPSGKLRQLIENGESFTLFLSASKRHTDALLEQGMVDNSEPFTRNSLCLMVAPARPIWKWSWPSIPM